MANKNYNKYSEKPTNKAPVDVTSVDEVVETPVEAPEEVKAEPVVETKPKFGVVTKCTRLNVRKLPNTNSQVLTVLNKGDKVEVIENGTTATFYAVKVNGFSGFCMKQYIKTK